MITTRTTRCALAKTAGAARFWLPLVGLAPLLLIGGCGAAGDIHNAASGETCSGTVTWEGKPLALGNIGLIPAANSNEAPNKALIENGRYEFPKRAGLAAGSYMVRISSKQDPKKIAPVGEGHGEGRKGIPDFNPVDPTAAELVPEKYNDATTLTVEIAPGDNTKDFHLTGVRSVSRSKASPGGGNQRRRPGRPE